MLTIFDDVAPRSKVREWAHAFVASPLVLPNDDLSVSDGWEVVVKGFPDISRVGLTGDCTALLIGLKDAPKESKTLAAAWRYCNLRYYFFMWMMVNRLAPNAEMFVEITNAEMWRGRLSDRFNGRPSSWMN